MSKTTRYEELINAAKNNVFVAIVCIIFLVTIAVSNFSDSFRNIVNDIVGDKKLIAEVSILNESVRFKELDYEPKGFGRVVDAPRLLVPPVLDIKIANNSDDVVFIKEIRVMSYSLSHEPPLIHCSGSHSEPTGYYDLEIASIGYSEQHEIEISHAIKSGEVDRVLLSVASAVDGESKYKLVLTLVGIGGFSLSLSPIEIHLSRIPGSCGNPVARRKYAIK